MVRKGRPPAIGPTQYEALRKVVQEHPHATLAELAIAWAEFSGAEAPCTLTLRRTLKAAGLQRQRPAMRPSQRTPTTRQRYGYTDRHRSASTHAGLTDAEWVLARELFEQASGSRGRPARPPEQQQRGREQPRW